MRMLRMICARTLRDGVSNETIRVMTGVEKIEEFLRKRADIAIIWVSVKNEDDQRTPVKAKNLKVWVKERQTEKEMKRISAKRRVG